MKPCKEYYDERPMRGRRGAHVTRKFGPAQAKPANSLLGQRLRDLRLAKGLDQSEVAAALGYKRSNARVSDHELGHHLPTLSLLRRYADVFGITVAELLDGVM
jgi:DNA-binding XRE family transcriptional regulator